MTLPNFLIIGPHKTGTTSLHRYLQQHPDVFLPELKEARYFSYQAGEPPAASSPFAWDETLHPIRTWDAYQRLFAPAQAQRAIGEASPCYFNNPRAPARIDAALPDVHLIASLRDPVDRAYSDYLMAVWNGRETRSFLDIMEKQSGWHATLAYSEPCRRWLDRFPGQRLRFIHAEALQAQPRSVLADLFSFLKVDPCVRVDTSVQFHKTGAPRSKQLHRILNGRSAQMARRYVPATLRTWLRPLKHANLHSAPELRPEDRARAIALLREHILELQDLLDEDLSRWLEVESRRTYQRPAPQARPNNAPSIPDAAAADFR